MNGGHGTWNGEISEQQLQPTVQYSDASILQALQGPQGPMFMELQVWQVFGVTLRFVK